MKIEIIEQNFPHFVSWFYLQDVFFVFVFSSSDFSVFLSCHCALHYYKGLRGVAICV